MTFGAVLGRVIAERRRKVGLSQEALAYRCGLHPVYISMVERAVRSPTIRVLVEISLAMGMSPSQLLEQAEEEARKEGIDLRMREAPDEPGLESRSRGQ